MRKEVNAPMTKKIVYIKKFGAIFAYEEAQIKGSAWKRVDGSLRIVDDPEEIRRIFGDAKLKEE